MTGADRAARVARHTARIEELQDTKSPGAHREIQHQRAELRALVCHTRARNAVMLAAFVATLTLLLGAYPYVFPQNYWFGEGSLPHAAYQLGAFAAALFLGDQAGRYMHRRAARRYAKWLGDARP